MPVTEQQYAKWAGRCAQVGVPDHMSDGVARYIEARIRPGGFLIALLSNNFIGAAQRADHENLAALGAWAKLFHNYLPGGSYGSPAAVEAWLKGE
jgi:hypothetical protein